MKRKINNVDILILVCSCLFVILTCVVLSNKFILIDSYFQSLMLNIRSNALTDTMMIITNIGSSYTLIAISFLLLFLLKKKKNALFILINLICSFACSQVFKFIFRRSRPSMGELVDTVGYSYPSGHTMVSICFFGFITYLLCKKEKTNVKKFFICLLYLLTIFFIGFSRIYLGAHYFSDVIAGGLLSIIYLCLFIRFLNRKEA